MRNRNLSGQFVPSSQTVKSTSYNDLPGTVEELLSHYESHDVISSVLDGWLQMRLKKNQGNGSKLNDNYAFYVPGQHRYETIIPSLFSNLQTSLVITDKIWYLLSIGKNYTEIATMLGMVRINLETGERSVNTAPIRKRDRDHIQFCNTT